MKDINKLLEERKGNLQETLNAIQSLQSQLQQAQEQALILKGAIAQLEELNKDIEEESCINNALYNLFALFSKQFQTFISKCKSGRHKPITQLPTSIFSDC